MLRYATSADGNIVVEIVGYAQRETGKVVVGLFYFMSTVEDLKRGSENIYGPSPIGEGFGLSREALIRIAGENAP